MKITPSRIVGVYAAVVITLALLAVTRIYVPKTAEEGEFYFPYLFVSGPFVWFAALRLTLHTKLAVSFPIASPMRPMLWIVIVPGIYNVLLGSIQWYLVAWIIMRARQIFLCKRRQNQKATCQ